MIGSNIKRIRTLRNITQLELANQIGVSDKTVSSWEAGRTEPKMGMIEKVCIALHCNKSEITGRDEASSDDEYLDRMVTYLKSLNPQNRATIEIMVKSLAEQEQR